MSTHQKTLTSNDTLVLLLSEYHTYKNPLLLRLKLLELSLVLCYVDNPTKLHGDVEVSLQRLRLTKIRGQSFLGRREG